MRVTAMKQTRDGRASELVAHFCGLLINQPADMLHIQARHLSRE